MRRMNPVEEVDTNLYQEGDNVANDEYLCYPLGFHHRVPCPNIGDEASIDDIVEGEKCGRRADDK